MAAQRPEDLLLRLAYEQVLRSLRSHQDDILRSIRSHQDDAERSLVAKRSHWIDT